MNDLQLAEFSRKVAQEAGLLSGNLTDAEKLRLGILLGYLKHGLRKIMPGSFDIVPVPINLLGDDYSIVKRSMNYKRRKPSLTKFLLQPEEAQFFSMSPKDKHNEVRVTLKPQALIPNPSREMRAVLPKVDWDPLPSLESVVTDASDEEEGDVALSRSSTLGVATVAPHSLFNPEPRQVGSFCSSTVAFHAGCFAVNLGERMARSNAAKPHHAILLLRVLSPQEKNISSIHL